ncbi:MAG: bZIP transcription factor, partial [Alphaproteobacteria bacterium]|nr:bZIP transcription factor [Alphaproteobacteria bacterium]
DATCNASKAGMLSWNSGTTLQLCTNTGSFVSVATASGVVGSSGTTGQVQFSNSNSGFLADSNFFWDNTNKYLGLGNATPVARLTVNGPQSTTLTNYTGALGSAGIVIDTAYTANAYTPGLFWRTSNDNATLPKAGIYLQETGSGTIMRLGTSNNYAGGLTSHVTIDWNGVLTATSVFHTSDRRLKDKIETMKGLEVVRKLRGVSFVWKKTGVESLGFIAQEVEGVLPMAVKTDVNGMKAVDYDMMIAPLVEAIKELDSEVTLLKTENAALRARVETLENTVKSLEERLKAIEEKLGATVH